MRRRGVENLPRSGPLLIVCNHVSVADPLVMMAAARPRRTAMMSKSELFKNRIVAAILHAVRAFPIRRGQPDFRAIRHACRLLESGPVRGGVPRGPRQPHRSHAPRATRAPGCSRCAPA